MSSEPSPGREATPRHAASFNLADLFESVVDTVPERVAVVMGKRRLTYADLDQRATRLAHHLADHGVKPGTMVGLQMENDPAYLETMIAAYKLRAVPINVNHRYVAGELEHLYLDASIHTLVIHRKFAARAVDVARDAGVHHVIIVDDGSDGVETAFDVPDGQAEYEEAISDAGSERLVGPRSEDDHYIVYTGGTTGLPKGVVWRHEDIFFAAMGGGDPFQFGDWITHPTELADRVLESPTVSLPTPPLVHASAQWLAMHQLFAGGRIVLTPFGRFDPAEVLDLIGREQVTTLVVVGDAMVQPLLAELEDHPDRYDLSTLLALGSGGARLSPHLVERLIAIVPHLIVVDAFGSSETGTLGSSSLTADSSGGSGRGARFSVGPQTAVLDADHIPVEKGSGAVGLLARTGHVPLGYLNDPEKTAATIIEAQGRRWVLTGDSATVEADGTVVLLGRGSSCINTGGEKVYPDEVEVVCTSHPSVADAVVVGVPDERWGERIVAVVTPGSTPDDVPTLDGLQDHCRKHLAGYKIPRALVVVDAIERTAAGKPDHRWAKNAALAADTGAG